MGREGLPGAAKRRHRRGLRVKTHANGTLYLSGTIRVRGDSVRIRKSTGLHRDDPGAPERAEEIRRQVEAEVQDQVIHGVRPSVRFARAAADYVLSAKPGKTDLDNLEDLIAAFGETLLTELDRVTIEAFYARRFPEAAPATKRRHMATLRAVFGSAVDTGLLAAVPFWTRPKVPRRKGRHIGKRFLAGEAELLIESAAAHARPMMAVAYATGARTGSVIHLLREHFLLAAGRARVFFPETKNGHAYSRPLPDYVVGILRAWLDARRDRHPQMFLTDKARPYARRPGHGGHLDAAFKAARTRCVAKLIAGGLEDRARVIGQATPHWFRHNLANRLRQDLRWDAKRIAEAGMWEDPRTVEDFYLGDEPEEIETALRALPYDQEVAAYKQRQ